MALEHYRAIKNDGVCPDITNLELTTLHQDKVIPGVRKKRKVEMTEEDLIEKRKVQMTEEGAIDWNAPL